MKFKKKLFNALIAAFLLSALFFMSPALGQGPAGAEMDKQLGAAAGVKGADLGIPRNPILTVILIIRVVLSLVGTALVVINVYAGITWMTAGGNEEKITEAKTLIRNGAIGLVIIISAYSLTIFTANLARGYTIKYYGQTSIWNWLLP